MFTTPGRPRLGWLARRRCNESFGFLRPAVGLFFASKIEIKSDRYLAATFLVKLPTAPIVEGQADG